MRQIDKAIAACNAQEYPCYQAIADEFGVKRTTLSRRHRGVQTSRENVTATHYSLLSKPQQNELVNYINKLSNKGLPPTIPVVRMLAIDICKTKPGKNWTWRFVRSYKDRLDHGFLQSINLARRKADSPKVYRAWFKDVRDPNYLKFLY